MHKAGHDYFRTRSARDQPRPSCKVADSQIVTFNIGEEEKREEESGAFVIKV